MFIPSMAVQRAELALAPIFSTARSEKGSHAIPWTICGSVRWDTRKPLRLYATAAIAAESFDLVMCLTYANVNVPARAYPAMTNGFHNNGCNDASIAGGYQNIV